MGCRGGILISRMHCTRHGKPLNMKMSRLTARDIVALKRAGQRIAALTAYDYTSAQMLDAAGVPLILIGDSLGMVIQGEDTTLPVTLEHIIYHSRSVARGTRRA